MSEAKSIIRELALWSSSLKFEDIPERVLDKARLQILSVLGAIHASYRTVEGRNLVLAAKDWSGSGPCTLLPTGDKVDLLSALFANAGLSMALDFDDYLLFGHTGHSAVLVPLQMAEKHGNSISETLTAQVIANEIEGRIGASVLLGPHNGQAWSHIHHIGSAAAASRMLKLDAQQTAHAMAISMYQPNYVLMPGFMGPDSKLLTAATPMLTGVQAALLAARGFTGALDIMENPQGFLERFSFYPLEFMISGLGRAWVTDTLAFKVYPGCAYIDTTVDAVLDLREEYKNSQGRKLDPEQVDHVTVEATALTIEMDQLSKVGEAFDPLNPVSINFSIPGNVAIALLKGRLGAEDLTREALAEHKDKILPLAGRVRLRHDVQLTAGMVAKMNQSLPIKDMAREINVLDFLKARSKLQSHYGRSMGLGYEELRDLYNKTGPEARSRVWGQVRKAVGQRISGEHKAVANPGSFDLGGADLENFTMPFAARVGIRMKDGTELSRLQEIPIGGPGRPLEETTERVKAKFADEARVNIDESQVNRVIEMLENYEGHEPAVDILNLCATRC